MNRIPNLSDSAPRLLINDEVTKKKLFSLLMFLVEAHIVAR